MRTKLFLLGCAAGFIALSSPANAAVEYVKICSLYGAGFYYIPGTDICMKVGGYVRTQNEWQSFNGLSYGSTNWVNTPGTTTGGTWGPSTIDDGSFTRSTNSVNYNFRGVISVDARNQSEYGTIRSYMRLGVSPLSSQPTAANSFFFDRAFIQFAGFTFGVTQSYFDMFSNTERFSYSDAKTSGDTTNYGVGTIAYTAQFGNGLSATIASEIPRNPGGVLDGTSAAFAVNGVTTQDTAGLNMPDIIGNVRVDQAWGHVGISGVLHRVAGQYYNTGENNGHPDDKIGWAAQIGGLVMLPWNNTFGASFVASKGAVAYATKAGSWQMYHGNSVGVGWVADGIFDNTAPFTNSQIYLTNAWSVNAGFEHKWNSQWKTSVYGGYTKIWYDDEAKNLINIHLPGAAGSMPCGVAVTGAVWPPVNVTAGDGNSCSPNFSFWQLGTRTQWNITRSLYMGLDVFYTRLNTAYKGSGPLLYPATTTKPAVSNVSDQETWSAIFRVQREFEP